MMFILAKITSVMLLVALSYISLKYMIIGVHSDSKVRSRLTIRSRRTQGRWATWLYRRYKLFIHLSELLESISSPIRTGQLLGIGFISAIGGVLIGTFFFSSMKGVISLGCILALIPYITVRMRLLTIQMRARINFLPAMEVFYQSYILSEHKNLRAVLKHSIEENRML